MSELLKVTILAALSALAITAVGQGAWGGLVTLNLALTPDLPWSAVVMAAILCLLFLAASGRTPPKSNAAARAALTPFGRVSVRAWIWSLVLGAAGIAALAVLWITLGGLIPTPPNRLPDPAQYPPLTMATLLVMGTLAAPLTEEIAFRGYATGILRKVVGPWTALVVASGLFALAHLTQGVLPTKLLVYFLAGLLFGFIAWRTGSLLPAMVVHGAADVISFTIVWPGDAARPRLAPGDAALSIQLVAIVVLTALCVAAAQGLARASTNAPRAPA